MSQIIAITNLKGGVGKTTTAINISACLGALGKKVLLIDADPQANSTLGLGIENIEYGIYQMLVNLCRPDQCIYSDKNKYFDIIPTNIDLVKLELNETKNDYYLIKKRLSVIKHNYDYIIIDSPPSLGTILLNVFAACNSILVTLQCEYFAFQGLQKLFIAIKSVKKEINPEIDIEGILITMYNKAVREHKHIAENIFEQFETLTFKTMVPQNIKLAEAATLGKSIIEYDINSSGAISYLNLANEIDKNNTVKADALYSSSIGNSFSNILEEDIIEDLDFILKINSTHKHLNTEKYNELIGFSKHDVKAKLGQIFNDMNSDIWMYRISERFSFLKKNYLYIHFEDNIVSTFYLKKFKINHSQEEFDMKKYLKTN